MIKEKLTSIEEKMNEFDLDGAAAELKELCGIYALYEIGGSLIHSEHITDFLLELVGDNKESGWQSMYCCLNAVQSLSSEWYYIDNYNTLNDLSLTTVQHLLDRLKQALSNEIEAEASEMNE